jgi:hypothetical protein
MKVKPTWCLFPVYVLISVNQYNISLLIQVINIIIRSNTIDTLYLFETVSYKCYNTSSGKLRYVLDATTNASQYFFTFEDAGMYGHRGQPTVIVFCLPD